MIQDGIYLLSGIRLTTSATGTQVSGLYKFSNQQQELITSTGFQLETGRLNTSYIPKDTRTRAADELYIPAVETGNVLAETAQGVTQVQPVTTGQTINVVELLEEYGNAKWVAIYNNPL